MCVHVRACVRACVRVRSVMPVKTRRTSDMFLTFFFWVRVTDFVKLTGQLPQGSSCLCFLSSGSQRARHAWRFTRINWTRPHAWVTNPPLTGPSFPTLFPFSKWYLLWQKLLFLLLFYVWVFCLYLCLCSTHVPGAGGASRGCLFPWTWNYWWF